MSQKIYTKLQQVRKRYSAKELRTIHHQTLAVVAELKGSEAKVILKLQDCDRLLVHRFIGYNSLFSYSVKALELTEHQALTYINVARKAAEIPELHDAIQKGEITVSKARRVTAVIDNDNKEKWIGLLKTSTKQVIEKAVAEVSPRAVHHEQIRRLTKDLHELRTPLTEEAAKNLTRVQDLLAQAKQRHVSREEAISEALALFIERMDPVRKAERAMARADKAKAQVELAELSATQAEEFDPLTERCSSDQREVQNGDKHGDYGSGQAADQRTELGPGQVVANLENQWSGLGDTDKKIQTQTLDEARPTVQNPRPAKCSVRPAAHNARPAVRKALPPPHRTPLKAREKHASMLKSRGMCEAIFSDGSRCAETRWIELHHQVAVAGGGSNAPENLITLCRAHHQSQHSGAVESFI